MSIAENLVFEFWINDRWVATVEFVDSLSSTYEAPFFFVIRDGLPNASGFLDVSR